jgi:hypothetical protein
MKPGDLIEPANNDSIARQGLFMVIEAPLKAPAGYSWVKVIVLRSKNHMAISCAYSLSDMAPGTIIELLADMYMVVNN